MRKFIITAILLSATLSIQTNRSMFINQAACNNVDQETSFFPIGINFTTSMKNLNTLKVSASSLISCANKNIQVEFVLNEVGTVTTLNQIEKQVLSSLSRTSPMNLQETSEWWKDFSKNFKGITIGARVSSSMDLVSIEIIYINPEVIMTLEALGKPFLENQYNYNFDEMRTITPTTTQTVVKTQVMTPEMMEVFKKQLMTKENLGQLLDNVEGHNQAMIETKEVNGNKVQVIVQSKLVQMVKSEEINKYLV